MAAGILGRDPFRPVPLGNRRANMIQTLTGILGWVIYAAQGGVALWGLYCLVVLWRRLQELPFRSEAAQDDFLRQLEPALVGQDFAAASLACQDDPRALPQLAALALGNRHLGYERLRHLCVDRFQRDVLADLDYRLSWVHTVVRSEPMLGLFGTVAGMMGAFDQLSAGDTVDAKNLAANISLALLTTAIGLAIAIPLSLAAANVLVKMRKMEDLVGLGLTRFFDLLKPAVSSPQSARG